MLHENAIETVPKNDKGISNTAGFFAVPKKQAGKFRPIISLIRLNKYLLRKKFKMVKYSDIALAITPGVFMVSLDLTKAYFTIPVAPQFWRFLRIFWSGSWYQFRTLCFGLNQAPRVFTKVVAVVIQWLRRVFNMHVYPYLDDFLILASSYEASVQARDIFFIVISVLGFRVNEEKSFLVPSHRILHLGFNWDSIARTVKVKAISSRCEKALSAGYISAKDLERLMGRLESVRFVVRTAPVFYRNLQRVMISTRSRPSLVISLRRKDLKTKRLVAELHWWARKFPLAG